MNKQLLWIAGAATLLCACCHNKQEKNIVPVPFTEVQLTEGFWKNRMQTELDVTVPFSVEQSAPAVERFRRCAAFRKGEPTELPQTHRFISSDLYKVMEGVSYSLMLRPDARLEQWMDSVIAYIAASQQEDGYLYISHICGNPNTEWMGERPYSFVMQSHELYNMGHLYEAAVAYQQATGKRQLLDVALKSAHHIQKVFFSGDPHYNDGKPVLQGPGHEEIELALCKLYRATGDISLLTLAQQFLDIRGVTFIPDGEGVNAPDYAQQHQPVCDQREATGHCVRAIYLYTGMAQVDALTHNRKYTEALNALWRDIVSRRMYLTGGVGADHDIETFGTPYCLPNDVAYNETCAAVANIFFNHAMFLAQGDGKFWDVAEIALFNNALAGVSMNGNRFFYVNPLSTDGIAPFNHGTAGRAPWFGCACCPPNISRLILQTPGFMYSHTAQDIYVTLYAGNAATIGLPEGKVALTQQTDYPFDGHIRLTVEPEQAMKFALRLRIPSWARGDQFIPEGLYSFLEQEHPSWRLLVNGKEVSPSMEKGFAVLSRQWQRGDVVELFLPTQPRFVKADERLQADSGCVAATRGPLVYCAESVDNQPDFLQTQWDAGILTERSSSDSLFAHIPLLQTQGFKDGEVTPVLLIPYYTWANRGEGTAMCVWNPQANE